MPTVPGQLDRSTMPAPGGFTNNVEMAQQINQNAVFASLANEAQHLRTVQAMKFDYTYGLNDSIVGQTTAAFFITIEQGTDFQGLYLTGSCFSYDAVNATDFPTPNSLGLVDWAARGLSMHVTDMRSGRELVSGFVPMELLLTPGYGINFQHPYPFKYFFLRNSQIRFDIRNRDNANRTHEFNIAINGYKILTPQ